MVSGVNSVSSYSANVQNSNKKTNSTVKGAAIGGGAVLAAGAATILGVGIRDGLAIAKYTKNELKKIAGLPMAQRKESIARMSRNFAIDGVNMSKTTVSKAAQRDFNVFAHLRDIRYIYKGLAVPLLAVAAIGAGIGAIIGHHSQKKAETSDISQMRLY